MAVVDAGIPMKDLVCGCSATFMDDTTMIGKFVARNLSQPVGLESNTIWCIQFTMIMYKVCM